MKKLLSICFLSIFLLMFGMQAQAQTDCCFSLSNLSGDTIHDLVNVAGGDLPVSQSMNQLQWHNTDVYALQFSDASCLSIDYATGKVSIELELWLDGENVLDGQHNLSRYCNITMQTTYNELHWVGSPMVGSNYPYAFEYPGAIQIFNGTYNISNVNFDYFFFNFLVNSQTKVIITWNQVFRDVQLIAHVRERIHGTNHEFYWDDQQRMNVGGHQSHPARILASDTMTTATYHEATDTIKDCEPVTVGAPAYTMDTTGVYKVAFLDTAGCGSRIDSIVTYYYTHYVHPTTPTLSDSTYRYCQKAEADSIVLPAETNPALADHVADIVSYWYFASLDTFLYAPSFTPITDTTPGNYEYYVKRHDNLTGCESEIDTLIVTINPNPASPAVANGIIEYCVGAIAAPLAYTAPIGMQVLWGTHPDVDSLSTTTIIPSTAIADTGVKVYYLRLQDTTTANQCVSEGYDSITVKLFANPVVTITHNADSLCYSDAVTLTAAPSTLSSYAWSKESVLLPNDTLYTLTDTNWTVAETFFHYSLAVTEKHDSVTCAANAIDSIKVYPLVGTPAPVRGDTAICGAGDVTLSVTAGANGTTAKWYKADKTTVIATDTLSYTIHFDATDSVFVSSLNAKGCETPDTSWLKITVTVDTVPTVTLSADNNAEICAEEDMMIRSTVTPSYTPITYAWNGIGLHDPLTVDSVRFNHNVAGQYVDTLTITDAHGCIAMGTISVTVDSLPVIVKDVNYTVKDNEFCVSKNGKIEFLTPDYVRYSIDSAATWRTTKVFDTLAAGNYNLVVEDSKGCKNHAKLDSIIDVIVMPAIATIDSANTRCLAPFNGKLAVQPTPASAAGSYEYSYQKNDGTAQTDSVFTGLEDGNYKITVTNTITGCKTDSLNRVVTDGKAIPVPTLASTNNTHCDIAYNGTVAVTAVAPATGAYHFRLTSPILVPDTTAYQTDSLFSGLYHGFYTAIVEDTLTACVGADTITVKYDGVLPTATINGPDYICYGDTNTVFSVNITDPNVYFTKWSYIGSVPDTTINTFRTKDTIKLKNYNTKEAFPPGTHILIANVRDTVTHCSNIIMDTIRVIAVNIDLITVPATTVCEYDTVKVYSKYIKADPSDSIKTYTWFNGNHVEYIAPGVYDTALVFPTNAASYVSLIVVDNHNCSGAFGKTIDVWELPKITITGDTAYCKGSNTNLVATVVTVNNTPTIEWWKGLSSLKTETSTFSTLTSEPVNNDFALEVRATDTKGCKNNKLVNIKSVDYPDDPTFTPDSMYFCTAADIVVPAPTQATPGGDLTWDTSDPNVTKTEGTYIAHYQVLAQGTKYCESAKDTVYVYVPGKPTFGITMKYNDEASATTAKERCYTTTPADTLKLTVTTTAVGTLTYSYKLNQNAPVTNSDIVITQTEAGTYNDTVKISVTQTYPDGNSCDWDTTVYYTLTVNALPTVPVNFPHAYNATPDSVIFYCEGGVADYNFTPQTGFTYTYSSGAKPTTAGSYQLIVTNDVTNCVDSFPYKIVAVPAPVVTVAHTADDKNCGETTINDTIRATITNVIPDSYTRFFVWNPGDSVAKTINADTLYHQFTVTDTMVTVKAGVYAANGDYTATCYKTPAYDTVKVLFQELPGMPKLDPAYTYYVDSAHAAYCAADHGTFSLTAANFLPIANATISIVGYTTVDTAGIYKVVANNNAAPNCPGDTLTLYVKEKRTPAEPTNIGASGYNYNVYFCDGNTPVYEFIKANEKDTFMYSADGTNFVYTKPDTAGDYTLRVKDLADTCYSDVNFHIIKVANPTFTITVNPTANWKNDTICQSSANYNHTFTLNITPTYTATTGVEHDTTIVWNGLTTDSIGHTYNFNVAGDTILYYAFDEFDTIGNMGYGVSCPFAGKKDTIRLKYYATPAVPVYSGDTTFCAGDSIKVQTSNFTLATTGAELVTTPALPVTFKAAGGKVTYYAQYTDFNACKSTVDSVKIVRYELPTVAITPATATICKGDSALLKVTGTANKFEWSTLATSSLAAIDSVFAKDSVYYTVTGTDTLHGNCKNVDSVKVNFYPVFNVTMSGDTSVCLDSSATILATVDGGSGLFSFHWFKADQYSSVDLGTFTTNPDPMVVTPDSSIKVNGVVIPSVYKVEVTDVVYNCVSDTADNVVNVSSFTGAQIVFTQRDSSKSIRSIDVNVGYPASFDMYIKDQGGCACEETGAKVYVTYQLYKNDTLLTDAILNNSMDAIALLAPNNTSYDFDLSVAAPYISSMKARSSFTTASGSMPEYNNFFVDYGYDFNWVYLHFLLGESDGMGGHNGRKISVSTGMWKQGSEGTYKFSYAVVKAGAGSTPHTLIYDATSVVGGNGRQVTNDTIIYDYFTINVKPNSTPGTDYIAPSVITPDPEETVVEKAMDMRVYPNPASNNVNVVLEGISGQTLVTIHDMSGKVVNSMRVDIDNDGQIINLPVENFSQGIYFIKAVNGKAVMTKKLIIAR